MIYVLFIGILFSVPVRIESSSVFETSENTCGGYCYKAVKPLMDYVIRRDKPSDTTSLEVNLLSFSSVNTQLALLEKKVVLQEQQLLELTRKLAKHEEMFLDNEKNAKSLLKNFQKIGKKYYYISDESMLNWFEAGHRCQELGGHLASIESKDEYLALVGRLNRKHSYWIDLNDLGHEGLFISQTTGRKGVYFNWYGKNPDNFKKLEHCVHLWNYKESLQMNDCPCTINQHFICEYSS